MRSTIGRLAKQATEKYLTPGNPTGLTGLTTAVAPRPVLINVYNRTLDELKKLPASSAYRTSAEALTRHRLAVLAAVKPAGHDAWLQRVTSKHPKVVAAAERAGHIFAIDPVMEIEYDPRYTSWDGEGDDAGVNDEGMLVEGQKLNLPEPDPEPPGPDDLIELEPPLTAEQISEIEQKLGAGLIEEVIEVAKGELQLVDVLSKHKVWEGLEEKAPEGQWNYFERSSRHTAGDPR